MLLENKRQSPIIFFSGDVLRGLLILSEVILISISIYSLNFSQNSINDIVNNWQTYPFEDIQLSINGKCNQGYRFMIEDEYWPGTVTGCKCPLYLYLDNCDPKDLLCYTVWSTDRRQITFWRKSLLCIKPYSLNYLNLSINVPKKGENCGLGFKNCGILDTLNNILCVPQNYKCPITEIKVVSINELNNTLSQKNYSIINLNDGTYFLFSQGINNNNDNNNLERKSNLNSISSLNKVIVDFKFSEGKVCLNPSQKNTQYKQYKLLKNIDVFKCSPQVENITFDDRYDIIDNNTLSNIFEDNNIIKTINSLPDYPKETLNADIGIYYRQYLGIKYECIWDEYSSPSNFIKNSDRFTNIFINQIVNVSISGIILIYFCFYKFFEFKVSKDEFNSKSFYLFEFIVIIFVCGLFTANLIYYKTISKSQLAFGNLITNNCSDYLTNKIFINFDSKISFTNIISIINLILTSIFVCILPSIYLIIFIFKKLRKTNSESLIHHNS